MKCSKKLYCFFFIVWAIWIGLFNQYVYSGDIFSWTDENGVTHIGEKPPKTKTSINNNCQKIGKTKEKDIDISEKYSSMWIRNESRTLEELYEAIAYDDKLYNMKLPEKNKIVEDIKSLERKKATTVGCQNKSFKRSRYF